MEKGQGQEIMATLQINFYWSTPALERDTHRQRETYREEKHEEESE